MRRDSSGESYNFPQLKNLSWKSLTFTEYRWDYENVNEKKKLPTHIKSHNGGVIFICICECIIFAINLKDISTIDPEFLILDPCTTSWVFFCLKDGFCFCGRRSSAYHRWSNQRTIKKDLFERAPNVLREISIIFAWTMRQQTNRKYMFVTIKWHHF